VKAKDNEMMRPYSVGPLQNPTPYVGGARTVHTEAQIGPPMLKVALGRRPRIGDQIDAEGKTLRVEALDGLRVAWVMVSEAPGAPSVSAK
jgi:hypothetical protein